MGGVSQSITPLHSSTEPHYHHHHFQHHTRTSSDTWEEEKMSGSKGTTDGEKTEQSEEMAFT